MRLRVSTQSAAAPESMRTEVNVAASIEVVVSASLQSNEFAAKASNASSGQQPRASWFAQTPSPLFGCP